ncbi:MAG: rod shape-determining protein MreD [Eubacteriaceae bacterium]|nr:rod shape-determining protein MreD [Eubacteriaceae bacterium]
MKTLIISLVLLLELILQGTFFQFMNIAGFYPDLVLITIVIIGIFHDKEYSWRFGLIAGLLTDIIYGRVLGFHGLLYLTVIVVVSILASNVFKESIVAPLLLFPIGSLVKNTMYYMITYLLKENIPIGEYLASFGIYYWVINMIALFAVFFLMLRYKKYWVVSN